MKKYLLISCIAENETILELIALIQNGGIDLSTEDDSISLNAAIDEVINVIESNLELIQDNLLEQPSEMLEGVQVILKTMEDDYLGKFEIKCKALAFDTLLPQKDLNILRDLDPFFSIYESSTQTVVWNSSKDV